MLKKQIGPDLHLSSFRTKSPSNATSEIQIITKYTPQNISLISTTTTTHANYTVFDLTIK